MGNDSLKGILNELLDEYSGRDTSVSFDQWLSDELTKFIPDVSARNTEAVTGEIISGIAEYDNKLNELNDAMEKGVSKEEWVSGQLSEAYAGMDLREAGEKIGSLACKLTEGNMQNLGENESIIFEDMDWNPYLLKSKVVEIGKQASLLGIASVAEALEGRMNSDVGSAVMHSIKDSIQGNDVQKVEIKAVVAGAVKVAVERGIPHIIPENTPLQTICDYAGMSVEAAEAAYDIAKGDITAVEGLDRIGRAAIVGVCRTGANFIKGVVSAVPVVGPLLTGLLSGLFEHLESPQFFNGVYNVVKDTVVATWSGIKNGIKSFVTDMLRN